MTAPHLRRVHGRLVWVKASSDRHYYAETRNRETGTTIITGHGDDLGLDVVTEGPWYTICEDHALLCSHPTLALARSHAAQPSGWCEGCQRVVYGEQ